MKKIILITILFCAGCERQIITLPDGAVTVSDGNGAATVQLITLTDGTKCAAMVGYYKGAISCNWR